MEGGFVSVEEVDILDEPAEALVFLVFEKVPVETVLRIPFTSLSEFASHKEQLFSWMSEGEPEIGPEIRSLLPFVSRHFSNERTFSVDDLVVGQGKDEILRERIDQAERELVVMILSMHGFIPYILQGVVHPAHIPFKAESEPTEIGWGPGGRFLRDHHHTRPACVDGFVQFLEKLDGLDVLPPTESVWDPLAFLPRIIEIQHRRDGVNAETVDVIAVEPEERVGDEEVPHLVAAVAVDEGAPVGVGALSRVVVLVEGGAVETGQTVVVAREMRGTQSRRTPIPLT